MKKLQMQTTVYTGEGALQALATYTDKKIFIVTDPFMVSSGLLEQVMASFDSSNTTAVFSEIIPDPPIETVVAGIETMQAFEGDIMVALGGGSAIDAAKAMKYFATTVNKMTALPLIVIPTTSGTGSEVTNFSIITSAAKGVKYPLVTDDILPDVAILDATLVQSVPPHITADTGMDVLTHALEAYVSTNANEMADALAEKVVQLVFAHLPQAYQTGNDLHAREKMHVASSMAGMAFNMTSLGLNHGIAHAAGAKLHIAHGRLNTLLLPAIIAYNSELTEVQTMPTNRAAVRYAHLAKLLGLSASNTRVGVKSLIREVKRLTQALAMPTRLSACGITNDQLESVIAEIATDALADRCTATNPRTPNQTEVVSIIRQIH